MTCDKPAGGIVVAAVVVVARGAAIAAAVVVSRVVDEDVAVSQCELTFPALSLSASWSGTRNCGNVEGSTRREIASERTWQQMRVAQ